MQPYFFCIPQRLAQTDRISLAAKQMLIVAVKRLAMEAWTLLELQLSMFGDHVLQLQNLNTSQLCLIWFEMSNRNWKVGQCGAMNCGSLGRVFLTFMVVFKCLILVSSNGYCQAALHRSALHH